MSSSYAIHVVDDNRLLRQSLVMMLEADGHCCCQHGSAREFFGCDRLRQPGCAVVDLHLDEGPSSGFDLLDRLADMQWPFPVIAITGDTRIATGAQAFAKGVRELLIKPFTSERLLAAVHEALKSIEHPEHLAHEIQLHRERFAALASDESEVIERLLDGHSTDQIAQALQMDGKSVDAIRRQAMAKLQTSNLIDIARIRALIARSA